jgi:hypothetical protein
MHIAVKSVLAAAAAVASIAASAQPFFGHDIAQIDARQARQAERIERGLARGDLTRREARTLQRGQREIARMEARAKADGHVSRDELRHLTAMLDQADAQIRQLRHDRDARRPA